MQAMFSDPGSAPSAQRAHSHLENGSEPQSQFMVGVMTRSSRDRTRIALQGVKLPIYPIQPR